MMLALVFGSSLQSQRFQSLNDNYAIARANCIYQDDYGFMWFGTRDGLVKYDGYSTVHYRKKIGDPSSLPGPEVLSILQISDSILLLGLHLHGLVYFDRTTGSCTPFKLLEEPDVINVNSLKKGISGSTWIGTDKGLFRYAEGKLDHFSSKNTDFYGLLDDEILTLHEDINGHLWIGTYYGMHRLLPENDKIENPNTNPTFPSFEILEIREDNNNVLWTSVLQGDYNMYKWDRSSQEFNGQPRYSNGEQFKFVFDHDNNLWVSSHRRGIYKFGSESEEIYLPSGYSNHGMRALFTGVIEKDRYQNIWLRGEDVYQVPGNGKPFQSLQSDGFNVISVFADKDYIWYCGKEPMRWSKKTYTSTPIFESSVPNYLNNKASIPDPMRIYHFEEMGENLVFTSLNELYLWNRKNDTYRKYSTRKEGAFRDFIIGKNGQAWIAGNEDKSILMDLENGKLQFPINLDQLKTVCAVDQQDNGIQWWGNRDHGLFSYDPDAGLLNKFIPNPNDPNSLSSYNINDILCHSSGEVWVGTKAGLNRIFPAEGKITRYHFEHITDNSYVASLLEDDNGTIWLGTQNGLVNINPATDSISHFTKDDGLINSIYTPRACFKDSEGILYFGGLNGIDFFQPEDIGVNNIPPDLYIKSLKVNNQVPEHPVAGECLKEITLDHDENIIEIELLGLHMTSLNGNTYSYRLPLQSQEWIDIGKNRTITLVKLPPGLYHLEGKCSNPDGVWSDPKRLLSITIKPPFWKSDWFITLFILLGMIGIYLAFKMRVQKIKKTEKMQTEFNKQFAEIEMKALRAQMNPHFLFNSLNSVKLLIDKKKDVEAKKYLTKFSELLRQILDNSRKKFVRLEEELNTLDIYLQLEQIRFKNFTYKIQVDENIPIDFLEIPPLLLQPFVENALWHGLMNKEVGEKLLLIDVTKEKNNVKIIIEDNGIGREQAKVLKSRSKKQKISLGTKISQDRLKYIRDLYGKEMYIKIIDLHDPLGTRVEIMMSMQD